MTENISRQGKIILECLKENSGVHLTADEISQALREKECPVSTATIYRQLDKLTALGIIRKYTSSPDEPACFQYHEEHSACVNHFHLKCVECGRLFHVSCEYLDKLERHISEHHGFTVDNTRTVLYGICSKCAENKVGCDEK